MRTLKIVQSNVEPSSKENLWVSGNYLKMFTENGWKDIIQASNAFDVVLERIKDLENNWTKQW